VTNWADELGAFLAEDFSGVVSVSRGPDIVFEQAYGLADRAHQVPCTTGTRFAIASGTKGFTALVVAQLIADGALSLDTTARSVLGGDLPLIGDDVTVQQLLTHTSGIGDYVDEETGELSLKVPVYNLVETTDYLPALDGIAAKFPAGARFGYCNSGYVVLALIAERVSGHRYHDLVRTRVLEPAGMRASGFLRSDELPGDAAIGYLTDGRTNVFALPVRGNGDGGIYTTVDDVRRFWAALFSGRLVDKEWVARMTSPQSAGPPEHRMSYGFGYWLDGTAVVLDGGDHGVSFRSVFDRSSGAVSTAMANLETPISPVVRKIQDLLTSAS
jgi:CubicO group peptidase (beta-lactamase class C family)